MVEVVEEMMAAVSIDYIVLEANSAEELRQAVLTKQRENWLPCGGVSITVLNDDDYIYAQAMGFNFYE